MSYSFGALNFRSKSVFALREFALKEVLNVWNVRVIHSGHGPAFGFALREISLSAMFSLTERALYSIRQIIKLAISLDFLRDFRIKLLT